MSKESALIFLGIFVIVVPFLGIPDMFRIILFVVSGAVISFLALLVYARERLLEQAKLKRRTRSPAAAGRSAAPRQGSARNRPNAPIEVAVSQE